MLKQRILTALVLIPLFVFAVIGLPNRYFALLLGVVMTLGAYEWARLSGLKNTVLSVVYAAVLSCLCFLLMYITNGTVKLQIVQFAPVWWCIALLLVIAYQFQWFSLPKHSLLLLCIGVLVLLPAWLSLVMLHREQQGVHLVLLLFALIWGADSFAYFAGRKWGKHRLASGVSPGKSWEGVFAALLTTLLIGLAYTMYQQMEKTALIVFPAICVLTVISSILGDLFESMIKRSGQFKDSGGLLPGHGGVLDRIDSLTAAAPVFFCALYWSGYWT